LSRHKEVCVGTGFQFPGGSQYTDVVQQILLQNWQVTVRPSGLQVFKNEASPLDNLLPEVDPPIAEPTSAIVEYPTLARENWFRFLVRLPHEILLPVKTTTGEPSARNAESGGRRRTLPSLRP
jgi:hypothetical protein